MPLDGTIDYDARRPRCLTRYEPVDARYDPPEHRDERMTGSLIPCRYTGVFSLLHCTPIQTTVSRLPDHNGRVWPPTCRANHYRLPAAALHRLSRLP